MAFQYHSENGKTLTRSQEELLDARKTEIIVDQEYGIVNTYQEDGFYHIVTQRLWPNPFLEMLVAKYE